VADKAEHMARLTLADLSLDTIGWHSGHSTTNELLCAGAPVLTVTGTTFASRVGASLVTAAGLPELVARDAAGYFETAISLGRDRASCAALKNKLMANRSHALLFDPRRIVAGLETVYSAMWQQFQSGRAPQLIKTE
jgi:predicted O-linked N-acetylglucosamine transferase (SPINDLY family)